MLPLMVISISKTLSTTSFDLFLYTYTSIHIFMYINKPIGKEEFVFRYNGSGVVCRHPINSLK